MRFVYFLIFEHYFIFCYIKYMRLFLILNRSKSLNQYFVDLTATATETSLAKKEEDLEMRQTLRLGLEERSAAKLVERAKWIGGGVVRNLIEL